MVFVLVFFGGFVFCFVSFLLLGCGFGLFLFVFFWGEVIFLGG